MRATRRLARLVEDPAGTESGQRPDEMAPSRTTNAGAPAAPVALRSRSCPGVSTAPMSSCLRPAAHAGQANDLAGKLTRVGVRLDVR